MLYVTFLIMAIVHCVHRQQEVADNEVLLGCKKARREPPPSWTEADKDIFFQGVLSVSEAMM